MTDDPLIGMEYSVQNMFKCILYGKWDSSALSEAKEYFELYVEQPMPKQILHKRLMETGSVLP